MSDDTIAEDIVAGQQLDPCNCCDVPGDAPIFNRPGLPALAYRVGTYATFFADMKSMLSTLILDGGNRPLAALTTRELDDPSIALLDSAALLGDILSFYQERIANEGFLRTATERRSLLELARAIGYELNPGLAAATYLAFTVDAPVVYTAGMVVPTRIDLPVGTKAQSMPGPNQLPQTFETTAPLEARVAWNAMAARATQRQELQVVSGVLQRVDPGPGNAATVAQSIWLDGTSTNVRVGDLLLVIVGPHNAWQYDPVPSVKSHRGIARVFVRAVAVDYTLKQTRVDLDQAFDTPPPFTPVSQTPATVTLAPLPLTLDNVRDHILAYDWDETDLSAYIQIQRWDADELVKLAAKVVADAPPAADVLVFRTRAAVFGHAAPPHKNLPSTSNWTKDWDDPANTIWTDSNGKYWSDRFKNKNWGLDLLLDRQVPLRGGSWIALHNHHEKANPPWPFLVGHASDISPVDFAISAKVTGLSLLDELGNAPIIKSDIFRMRDTSVFVQADKLTLIEAPIVETLGTPAAPAQSLMLDRMVLGLRPGQKVALSGTKINKNGKPTNVQATEVCELLKVTHSRGYTILAFKDSLAHAYVRSTVTVNGNVAPATHGETVPGEIVGSGDASKANQTFTLKKPPLTYVSAATASGGQSTLTLRVNGVAWREVPTLYGSGPNDSVYTVRNQDDGTSDVRFGDGNVGARLPTGSQNVVATYRSGLGPLGELDAGVISLLQSRPLGLKSVINPVPSTGAAPPEKPADARQNAPRTVRTLDRVVSLSDYEDFARGFAGVGKAQAVPLWSGETRLVHITVGSTQGGPLDPKSQQWSNLIAGINAAGDSSHQVKINNFLPAYFRLQATVVIDPARDLDTVLAAVKAALHASFAYAARDLAQTVTEAEIIEYAQAIPGVIAVEITLLYRADGPAGLAGTLPANGAYFDTATGKIIPAELLLLHPVGLSLVGANP